MRPTPPSRGALPLIGSQVRYQLRLMVRTPLSTFTIAVIPLLLLVTLNAVMPADALAAMRGRGRYIDFLTPAMAAFAVVNAAYINVITSVVLARDSGILKRLRATPLPAWVHVGGRLVAAVVTSVVAGSLVVAVGVVFLGAHLGAGQIGYGLLLMLLSSACLGVIALAVSVVVPNPGSALPIAYGTVLPLGFISDVFFPATAAPHWLHEVAALFPLAAVAHTAEALFGLDAGAWPMTTREAVTVAAWTAAGVVVAVAAFRWEPGPLRTRARAG
jgi:ABC-2 type transport system permease protein